MLVLGAAGLAGCATASRPTLPPAAQGVGVIPISSPSVIVRDPLLRERDGQFELVGFVVKVYEARTTENTHLDVSFLDAGGKNLRTATTEFSPQRLITGRRAPNRQGSYALPIAALPTGTARIEVRAHDGPHPQT